MTSFGFSPEDDESEVFCDPIGIHTSSESPELFRSEVTVNVTKSVQLSWGVTVESDPQDITEARQVWKDVAVALGELQMYLLDRATPTASPSTQS